MKLKSATGAFVLAIAFGPLMVMSASAAPKTVANTAATTGCAPTYAWAGLQVNPMSATSDALETWQFGGANNPAGIKITSINIFASDRPTPLGRALPDPTTVLYLVGKTNGAVTFNQSLAPLLPDEPIDGNFNSKSFQSTAGNSGNANDIHDNILLAGAVKDLNSGVFNANLHEDFPYGLLMNAGDNLFIWLSNLNQDAPEAQMTFSYVDASCAL